MLSRHRKTWVVFDKQTGFKNLPITGLVISLHFLQVSGR